MSEAEKALPVILAHEGGYTDDPSDPGGATKYGISLRFLKSEGLDINGDGDVNADDVRCLTKTAALSVYRERIWEREGWGRIIDQQVATKCFDMAVNLGHRRATRLLQNALRACGETIEPDGILGPGTIAAANRCEARELLLELCDEHTKFYRLLVELKPRFEKYLPGWLKRARWPFGANEYLPSKETA